MPIRDLQHLIDHCGFTYEVLPWSRPGFVLWRMRNSFGVQWGDFLIPDPLPTPRRKRQAPRPASAPILALAVL